MKHKILTLMLLGTLSTAASAQQAQDQAGGKQLNAVPLSGGIVSYSGPMFFPSAPEKRKAYSMAWQLTQKAIKLSRNKDWKSAILMFQQALTIYPDSPPAYSGLAQAYIKQGQVTDAITALRQLYYGWPSRDWSSDVECWGDTPDKYTYMPNLEKDAALLMQFALLLEQTNQDKEALAVYHRAYRYLPTDRALLPPVPDTAALTATGLEAVTRTGLAMVESDKQDALSQLQTAISLQPSFAVAYYDQGEILKWQDGRAVEAMDDFSKAAQLGGPEMKPFLDKALKEGTAEFTAAVKKAGVSDTAAP